MNKNLHLMAFICCALAVANGMESCTSQPTTSQSATSAAGSTQPAASSTQPAVNHQPLPEGAIPFIFDRHLYLQAQLNDTLCAWLVYDTGADCLYLDEDYLAQNQLQNAFQPTQTMLMGGAGNAGPKPVQVIMKPISIRLQQHQMESPITPIIRLRDILGCHVDGLLGNWNFYAHPLYVSYSQQYLQPLDSIPASMLQGYTPLKAQFKHNRIYLEGKLTVQAGSEVSGLFLLDLGSGSGLSLTQAAYASLHLADVPQAPYYTQAGGIGGASESVVIRAEHFILADTLKNPVVDCSLNTAGALADRAYKGLIGNQILSCYDLLFDPQNQVIYFKKTSQQPKYAQASTLHMAYFDRTDVCNGWVVNGLYKHGIAAKAGIEIGDIILSINGRPVKEITWQEQRSLTLEGPTRFIVQKADGSQQEYQLNIGQPIL